MTHKPATLFSYKRNSQGACITQRIHNELLGVIGVWHVQKRSSCQSMDTRNICRCFKAENLAHCTLFLAVLTAKLTDAGGP